MGQNDYSPSDIGFVRNIDCNGLLNVKFGLGLSPYHKEIIGFRSYSFYRPSKFGFDTTLHFKIYF